jgi:hypothetical protein
MDHKDHLKIDKVIFGKEFEHVHKWLDSTFPKYANHPVPYMHWLNYHHMEAIREKYGDFTPEFNAAYVHIMCDYVHHFNMAYVPKDMTDTVDTFLALGVIKRD